MHCKCLARYQGLCLSFQGLFPTGVLISDELVGGAVAIFRHASLKEQWDRLNRDDNIKEGDMELVVLPHVKYPLHISVTTPNFLGRTNSNASAIFLSLKIPASFFLLLPLLYNRSCLLTFLLVLFFFCPGCCPSFFIHVLIFQPVCFVR